MRRRYITNNDYERLSLFFENENLKPNKSNPEYQLYCELLSATLFEKENISNRVITMNSRVKLKELTSGIEIELTITYPKDANVHEQKISIFSEIGVALLGKVIDDVVTWKIPGGTGYFEITNVIYQPEAVGHYHL